MRVLLTKMGRSLEVLVTLHAGISALNISVVAGTHFRLESRTTGVVSYEADTS